MVVPLGRLLCQESWYPACVDPVSGQRLASIAAQPAGARAAAIREAQNAGTVRVRFGPDGAVSASTHPRDHLAVMATR
jgi:hypothetical protein